MSIGRILDWHRRIQEIFVSLAKNRPILAALMSTMFIVFVIMVEIYANKTPLVFVKWIAVVMLFSFALRGRLEK